jgi:predicted GNAT family acetyltransferase
MSEVPENVAEERFEVTEDGHLAELVYHVHGDRLTLIHTEVPDELGGRGIGGILVKAALARAARDHLTIVPSCPFARSWLEKHRDQIGGVTIDW